MQIYKTQLEKAYKDVVPLHLFENIVELVFRNVMRKTYGEYYLLQFAKTGLSKTHVVASKSKSGHSSIFVSHSIFYLNIYSK